MKKYIAYCIPFLIFGSISASSQEAQLSQSNAKNDSARSVTKKYQTRHITGRVINGTTDQPVSGAIIRVAEMEGYSSLSHSDGTYEMDVPTFAYSIVVSAPDMNNSQMGLGRDIQQKIVKIYPEVFLSEYAQGTNLRADKQTSDFRFSNAVNIGEEIQKRMGADAYTIQRNGTLGIGNVMFLSGLNSLNINAQPLIVVDGVIFDQQYNRSMIHQGFYNSVLSNISPADIENVTIMKNGTALYGSKGANGVILIQTRRNHSMATRITASISAGVSIEPKFIDMMNATQYKSYASDLLGTTNTTALDFKFLNEDPNYYYYPQYHNDTDWKKQVYRTAITQNYSINVEGGDGVANYNLSLGYINNQSTLRYNSMNRVNIRFNTDIKLMQNFSVRFDASFSNQTRNLRNDGAPENYSDGTPTSPSFLAYAKSPMLSPYAYANGVLSESFLDITDETYLDEALSLYNNYNYKLANPIAINLYGDAENKNHFESSMVNLSVTPKFSFNPHMFMSEHFSYNLVNVNESYYIPMNGVPDYYVAAVGAYRQNETRALVSKQNSVYSDTRLDWQQRFGAHDFHIFGGARINWESYTLNNQLGYNTGNDKTPFMSPSLLNAQTTGENDNWNSIAWYLQSEYNYLQRYYLQANITAEASSRFGSQADNSLKLFGVPWGIFPGIQLGWVVTNEPWFATTRGIDYLRINAGYDISGNDDIDYYAARSYFSAHQFMQSVAGLSFDNIGNTHLQWETTKRFNFGFESNLLENRLNLRFNYYLSHTDHLLTFQSLSYLSGLDQNWSNGGALKNQGFDISATGKVITTKSFQWELGVSLGHYKNKITVLNDNQNAINTTIYGATIHTEIGQAANLFYGYKSLGVFSTSEEAKTAGLYIMDVNGVDKQYFGAGDLQFMDINGDHEITDADQTVIGDPNPDIYGNIFTSFNYNRLRLDLSFNYSLGNDVYDYLRSQLESGSRFMNQTTAVVNRWQTEGQITDVPKAVFQDPMGNGRFSDRWIEDGSYMKLKTITLSYTLPVHSTFFQGFQFWLQANNVLTFSKYLGADPEFAATSRVLGQGIDLGQLPQSRSFVAGVKINL